ncbi:MAG: DUF4249 family protein [Bacteroidales bacterium]|nr:DUF4249 family protein [Bacteroidales bacterium]
MKKFIYLLLFLPLFLLVSCEVDFDPNDSWQERMMIYCLLDQDDDTTFVRIEKCFLGNGNAYEYAKNKDSVYYAKDELDVKMYAYSIWDTSKVIETYDFQYTTRKKTDGQFYSGDDCPLYCCDTKGKLSVNNLYKLVITNTKTGKQAIGRVSLLGDYSIETNTFTFTESRGSMKIVWSNLRNSTSNDRSAMPKQFSVNIRFNYTENGEIKNVDIPVSTKTNNGIKFTHETKIDTATIISYLRVKMKDKKHIAWYGKAPFEIRVSACDLSMFDYLSVNNATQNALNYSPVYSNIDGGFGLFAARRNHINRAFEDREIDNNLKESMKTLLNL